jgi:hypothetical protein
MAEENYRFIRNRHENLIASIQQLVFFYRSAKVLITIHGNRWHVVRHAAVNVLRG